MLYFHHLLGLSDAMMSAPKPGETFWPLYNILMIAVFHLGQAGYSAHAFWMFSKSAREWVWLTVKCGALVLGWIIIFAMLPST